MGQYYKPVVLKKVFKENTEDCVLASLSSYDYNNGAKLMEHSYVGNNFVRAFCQLIGDESGEFYGYPVVWCGDYADKVNDFSIYSLAYEKAKQNKMQPKTFVSYKYLVNLDKKEYVVIPEFDDTKWTIHPLPLLTASGNGRGGGDYHGSNMEMVGAWAFDCVGLTNKLPEDFEELKIEFLEED